MSMTNKGRGASRACVWGEIMRFNRLGRKARMALVGLAAAAVAAACLALPAQAATGPVSSTPAVGTPQLGLDPANGNLFLPYR